MKLPHLFHRASLLLALPGTALLSGCFSLTINTQAPPTDSQVRVVRAAEPTPEVLVAKAPTAVRSGFYSLGTTATNCPQLTLESVQVTADATLLRLRFSGHGSIATAPPGHEEAFYLQDADTGTRYELLGVEGIAITPSRQRSLDEESVEFTLRMEPLGRDVRRFHLIEPDPWPANPWFHYWEFHDVALR
ncbi:MAG: hypothetical protein FJX77_05640 [Armatimonadetes bacterium]|nr:hypothetical protein [Armatimonadota bacterium]